MILFLLAPLCVFAIAKENKKKIIITTWCDVRRYWVSVRQQHFLAWKSFYNPFSFWQNKNGILYKCPSEHELKIYSVWHLIIMQTPFRMIDVWKWKWKWIPCHDIRKHLYNMRCDLVILAYIFFYIVPSTFASGCLNVMSLTHLDMKVEW